MSFSDSRSLTRDVPRSTFGRGGRHFDCLVVYRSRHTFPQRADGEPKMGGGMVGATVCGWGKGRWCGREFFMGPPSVAVERTVRAGQSYPPRIGRQPMGQVSRAAHSGVRESCSRITCFRSSVLARRPYSGGLQRVVSSGSLLFRSLSGVRGVGRWCMCWEGAPGAGGRGRSGGGGGRWWGVVVRRFHGICHDGPCSRSASPS